MRCRVENRLKEIQLTGIHWTECDEPLGKGFVWGEADVEERGFQNVAVVMIAPKVGAVNAVQMNSTGLGIHGSGTNDRDDGHKEDEQSL